MERIVTGCTVGRGPLDAIRAAEQNSAGGCAAAAEVEFPSAAAVAPQKARNSNRLLRNGAKVRRTDNAGLPKDLFSRSPQEGAPILQRYLDGLPANERYDALAPLVRKEWKWFCRAAPHLKFPEPKPLREGEPIRIGISISKLKYGGAERVMQQLADHFANKSNYRATIFLDAQWANSIDYPLDPSVKVVPVKKFLNWEEEMRKHPQDLIICPEHWLATNFQNAFLLKSLGIRVLLQERSSSDFFSPFGNLSEKFEHLTPLYSACDGMSCLSRSDLRKWQGQGTTNSIYLPNPPTFPVESVTPSPLDGKKILWVGRWNQNQKRPELALRAFAKVLKKIPDARLVMLGENGGPCRSHFLKCKSLIEDLGIGHAVEIAGFQKNLVPYYSSGALLLCTSRIEGFSMAVQEAKTFGLPVVSTAMPYLETLRHGCVQVPQGDADALAAAAIDLLQDDGKRKQLGAEARRDLLENFSESAAYGKYEALIGAILEGPDAVRELCARDAEEMDRSSA
ncbi:MAG: glycosyltransferase [Puniceicoccales bacterium]|nr:glycosyltransferase [Puniceicoccales bacterium]